MTKNDRRKKEMGKRIIMHILVNFLVIIGVLVMLTLICVGNVRDNRDKIMSRKQVLPVYNAYALEINEGDSYSVTYLIDNENINTTFKAFMGYHMITDKTSKQYEMQKEATTDEHGFRKYNDMYMIAVGSRYASECGKIFSVKLSTTKTIKCIVSDIKADENTDETNSYTLCVDKAGNICYDEIGRPMVNVIEFIVDVNELDESIRNVSGTMCSTGIEGEIISLTEEITREN